MLLRAALNAQISVRFGCSSDHDTHIGGASLFRCGRAACSLDSSVILDPDIKRAVKMAPAFVANSIRFIQSEKSKACTEPVEPFVVC
jgi:hypothetical protein